MRTIVVCAVLTVACLGLTLPSLTVSTDDHYEMGKQIGAQFADRIASFMKNHSEYQEFLIPFYESTEGREIYDRYVALNNATYPEYWAEVEGIAEGAKVDLHLIGLLQFEMEIFLLSLENVTTSKNPRMTPACTDYYFNGEEGRVLLGHNEDSDTEVKTTAYFVEKTDSKGRFEYWSYVYPGYIFGTAFGFNNNGLVFTFNAVLPSNVNPNTTGLARQFIHRDIYTATSIDDAIYRATRYDCASGFSMNVGSLDESRLVNIEVAPEGYRVLEVSGNYSHENMYRGLVTPQFTDPSSQHRLARINMLPVATNTTAVLNILGDTWDPLYPIYRDGAPPDLDAVTAITALFNLTARTVELFLDNPRLYPTTGTTLSLVNPSN